MSGQREDAAGGDPPAAPESTSVEGAQAESPAADPEPKAKARRTLKASKAGEADRPNLLQRLAAIMGDLDPPGKKGKASSDAGGFAFLRHDDLAAALRPLLAKHGVVMLPTLRADDYTFERGHKASGRDDPSVPHLVRVNLCVMVVNADDPTDCLELWMPGHGFDYGDKSIGKAVTYAMKTLGVHLFWAAGGEDNEADSVTDQPRAQSSKQRQQTPAQRQRDAGRGQAAPHPSSGSSRERGSGEAKPAAAKAQAPAGQAAQGSTQHNQRPALRWLWKVVREQEIDESVLRSYIARNYGVKSTTDLSDDQLKEVSSWASQLKGLRTKLLVTLRAGRVDDDQLAEKLGEWYGGATVDVLTVDELDATIRWAERQADEGVPWDDPADDAGDQSAPPAPAQENANDGS